MNGCVDDSIVPEAVIPWHSIREIEAGVEWQAMKGIELTAAFLTGSRSSPLPPYAQVNGHLLRLQLQFNY